MTDATCTEGVDLATENRLLRERVVMLEKAEQDHQEMLRQLSEKEAFNFALFQYNPALTVVVDKDGRILKTNAAKKKHGGRVPNIGDIMYKDYASHHQRDMHSELIAAIRNNTMRHFRELPYDNKVLSVTISPFSGGAIIISQDITEQKTSERNLNSTIYELKRALDEVETLRGLLPICASCKKIRDDKGYWNHIEVYFSNHSQVDFTHTLCPECIRHFYPEYWKKQQEKLAETAVTQSA